jgi:thiol-disulfide isomerase/thioredoxin
MASFASSELFICLIISLLILSTAQAKSKKPKVERYDLKYYEDFFNFKNSFNSNGRIVNFYFYGEKNITVCQKVLSLSLLSIFNDFLNLIKGNSFCSDCDAAGPYINEAVKVYGRNTVFVTVNIGDK